MEYATSEQGHLIFAFSSMSSHTTDVKHTGKASLTITAPGFKVNLEFQAPRKANVNFFINRIMR